MHRLFEGYLKFHSQVSRGLLGPPCEAVLVHLLLLRDCAAVGSWIGHEPAAVPMITQLLFDAKRAQSVAMSTSCHLFNI